MVGHHKRWRTKIFYYKVGLYWPCSGENVIHQFQLNINIDVLKADRRQETGDIERNSDQPGRIIFQSS